MRYRLLAGFVLFAIVAIVWAQRRQPEPYYGRAVQGTHGAAIGGTHHGTGAAMRLMQAGGNAVDAGVAAMVAGSMVEYSHFGFGGEAPILIRTKEGKVFSIAGVGTMPKLATADFFRNREPKVGEVQEFEKTGIKGFIPVSGIMPTLVPSMVEAALVSLREFGTKSVEEVFTPAIELADGAPTDELRSRMVEYTRQFLMLWPTSQRVFLPNGQPPQVGEIFHQPDLARTLRSMVEAEKKAKAKGTSREEAIDAVRDYFYRGEIARKIDAFVKENDGLLRYEDMAAFRLKPEAAVSTSYHGYEIYKPGFWSQGPAFVEAANLLEGYDLKSLGHNSPEYLHRLVESMKLAYADRDTYYGDPEFNHLPFSRLLTKDYANERRMLIGEKASMDFLPGLKDLPEEHPTAGHLIARRIDDALMAKDTTALGAIDNEGMMFVATPSGAWLPSVIAGDTGIPLGQRAQSFLLLKGHPNELAGGKRPRITLSPTLVTRDGKPAMVFSTPGGDNQEQALMQVFLNVVEFGLNAEQAVEAPRVQTRHLVASFDNHAVGRGELLVDERISQDTMRDLAERGHKVGVQSKWRSGAAPALIRVLPNGVIEAGADPFGNVTATAY